jgi:hypothetical protein
MRLLFTAVLIVWSLGYADACDVCGCSVGGNYFGILPQFRRHFVGIRYQYRPFQSTHATLFEGETPLVTKEYFHTAELWGRYVPHKNVQLYAFVPTNYFLKTEEGKKTEYSGLGDISLMANYFVLNTGDSAARNWKHALQVGAGVKLPTGKANKVENDVRLNPYLQMGTGSLDIPLSIIYTLRYKRFGLNAEANYRVNTPNQQSYRFGNRLASSARLFYWHKVKSNSFLPNAGINYESADRDTDNGVGKEFTGGYSVFANIGIDIFYRDFSLNLSARPPLHEHFGDGNVKSFTRFAASFVYLF